MAFLSSSISYVLNSRWFKPIHVHVNAPVVLGHLSDNNNHFWLQKYSLLNAFRLYSDYYSIKMIDLT
jgi:hypothetical protein